MEREGRPEASEEAGERDRALIHTKEVMAVSTIPAVATGWNKWTIILDWLESSSCRVAGQRLRGCRCSGLFSIWKLLISSGPAYWGASPGSACH